MALIIECLQGNAGLELALPVRRRVFAEQEGYMLSESPLLQDEFDFSQDTFHVVARRDGEPVGAVRFTLHKEMGTAADRHFDFAPHVPVRSACAAGGYLCVDRGHRHGHRVYAAMMSCFYLWARAAGATHMKGIINPAAADHFLAARYRFLAPPFHSSHLGLPCIPVLVELDSLDAAEHEFAARHSIARDGESHCRVFMATGERIGQSDRWHLLSLAIVRGTVEISSGTGASEILHEGCAMTLHDGEAAMPTQDLLVLTDLEAIGRLRRQSEVACLLPDHEHPLPPLTLPTLKPAGRSLL